MVNTNTWVYTYIGTSSGTDNYIDFYVNKPSTYGQYRMWFEGYNEQGFTGYAPMGDPYTGVAFSNGIFNFASQSDYANLMARLEQAVEDHEDAFFNTYSYMTDEQLDAQIDATGFDEDLPLRDFEGYFGISSLRASIAAGEQSYLDGDLETDPDDETIVTDEIQRTLMNTSAQLKIHGTMYDPNEEYYEEGNCRIIQRRVMKHYNSAVNRRTKVVVEFNGFYFGTTLISKTKYYKKKNNGQWKKYPGELKARASGGVYDNDCSYDQIFASNLKVEKTKRRFVSKRFYPMTFRQIQSGYMGSSHQSNGDYYNLSITW